MRKKAVKTLPPKKPTELPEHEQAYHAAVEADSAWQLALVEKFGSGACNARYEPRGKSAPKLKRLYEAKRAADERLAEAWRKLGPTQSATQSTVSVASGGRDLFN